MISVVIPTFNSAQTLAQTFASLVSPTVSGLVREVIVTDGGSTDDTIEIAQAAGATIVTGGKGRGQQLARGASIAKEPFLLFLHSDTGLEEGWAQEVTPLVEGALAAEPMRGVPAEAKFAAAFRFLLKDHSRRARLLEKLVALRCALLKAPYGDQGLLISRTFHDEVGGFAEIALMEDVDLVRRIGRRRIVMLRSAALTSAEKYQRSGYLLRILRNASVMTLWVLRVPTRVLVRLYG